MNPTEPSHAAELQPLQDAFGVLFFVAVGMLFDPAILIQKPLQVVLVVAIIVIGKSLAALGIVLVLGHALTRALLISAALAQIGEFSFILVEIGVELKLLPGEAQSLIVAGSLISIALNPLVFYAIDKLSPFITVRGSDARKTGAG